MHRSAARRTRRRISFRDEMRVLGVMHCGRDWGGGAKRQRGGAFLVVFFRQEAEDEFTHAQEVDHLGDAEQRGDDQGSTVGPLQEG